MKSEILKKFPKFLRLNSQYKIDYVWGIEERMQRIIQNNIHKQKLTLDKTLVVEKGTLELYQVSGSSKYLVILNKSSDHPFHCGQLCRHSPQLT
ncbi:MAG: hypothetical protein AAGU27_27450 [Dehalobacterium sp.]